MNILNCINKSMHWFDFIKSNILSKKRVPGLDFLQQRKNVCRGGQGMYVEGGEVVQRENSVVIWLA